MSWVERVGKYVALAWLFLMWPVLSGPIRGTVVGVRAGTLVASLLAYCVIYAGYCLVGHRTRDARVAVATVAALTLLALALDHLSGEPANNYFLIPLLVAGFSLRPKAAVVAFAAVGASSMLDVILLTKLPTAQVVFASVLVVPGVVLFGGSAIGLHYLLVTLAELRAARAEIAQHAADQERSRIARDLHDLLGHSLSLITLKGELATRLLPEGAPGVDDVRDMLGLSRQALQEVREAVSGYRKPTLATELMVARVALQAAGVEVEVKQDIGALDREAEAVLGWVIREATTNVIRHSGAKRCYIALTRDDGHVRIEVTNDGWRYLRHLPATAFGELKSVLPRSAGNWTPLRSRAPASGWSPVFRFSRAQVPARSNRRSTHDSGSNRGGPGDGARSPTRASRARS